MRLHCLPCLARPVVVIVVAVGLGLALGACGGRAVEGDNVTATRMLPTGPTPASGSNHAPTPFFIDPDIPPPGLDTEWKQLFDGAGNPGPVWVRLRFVYPSPGGVVDPTAVTDSTPPTPGRAFHYVAEACMDPVPNPHDNPHLASAYVRGYWSLEGNGPINRRTDTAVQVIHAVVPNGGCVTLRRLPPEWGGTHGEQWVFFDPPGARYLMFGARYGRDFFFTWNDQACPASAEIGSSTARPPCVLRSAHLLDYRWAEGTVIPTPDPAPAPAPAPAPPAPIVARDDAYTTGRGSVLTIPAPGVLANDSVPAGSSFVRFLQPFSFPSGVGFGNLGGGSFSLDLSRAPTFAGMLTFQYQVGAGGSTSNTATVSVTVN